MPSWDSFERQPQEYRDVVLPPDIRVRVSIEAGIGQRWYRYVGDSGRVIGIEHFGALAPYRTLYEKFELTSEKVVETALACLKITTWILMLQIDSSNFIVLIR